MGRTIPRSNQANAGLIRDLAKVREGLTTDENKLWEESMQTARLNERAISLVVFCDPLQSKTLAMLFKRFKIIKSFGGNFSEWQSRSTTRSLLDLRGRLVVATLALLGGRKHITPIGSS